MGIEDGSDFRFMQVNVVGSGKTGLISVKYSDRNQEWQVLPGMMHEPRKHGHQLLMIIGKLIVIIT